MDILTRVLIGFLAVMATFLIYPIVVGIFGLVFSVAAILYVAICIVIVAAALYFLLLFFFKKTTNLFR